MSALSEPLAGGGPLIEKQKEGDEAYGRGRNKKIDGEVEEGRRMESVGAIGGK